MAIVRTGQRRRVALRGFGAITPSPSTYGGKGSPPDALAQAAIAILAGLPSGAFINPIGVDPAYPWPPNQPGVVAGQVKGADGSWHDYYNVNPAPDPSALIVWTGPDSYQAVSGLNPSQLLAVQVATGPMLSPTVADVSWSADFNPANAAASAAPIPTAPPSTEIGVFAPAPVTAPAAPPPEVITSLSSPPAGSSNPFDKLTFTYQLQGQATYLAFSDGTVYKYAGPTAVLDVDGLWYWRYGLDDPTTGIQNVTGPVIDAARFHAWFTQNGWTWDPTLDAPPRPQVVPGISSGSSSSSSSSATPASSTPASSSPASSAPASATGGVTDGSSPASAAGAPSQTAVSSATGAAVSGSGSEGTSASVVTTPASSMGLGTLLLIAAGVGGAVWLAKRRR